MDNTTITTTEFPLPKNSYAAFDAIAMRNLILERLNQQGIFTDQNYIGSNLAAIIDIVSYVFNTLIFYLHRTSNEATFTEAQLFENMNRIVKLLDYKPIGFQTSTLSFEVSAIQFAQGFYTIPKYSYLLIGEAPFSFNEDVSFSIQSDISVQPLSDLSNKKLLYQGIFREYPIYSAIGDANETLILNLDGINIDHFNVDVYVYESKKEKWVEYKEVSNLYVEQSFDRVYERRLNSELRYEITFGDDINGRKLEEGDLVAVYYLESSGDKGVVGPGSLKNSKNGSVIFSTTTFNKIKTDVNEEKFVYISAADFKSLLFNNIAGSTLPKDIESVESIRKNAPSLFKSQYRLVTKSDYETFIKINFANFISDVKIFNNWEYASKYLKYFEDVQISPDNFRQIVFNQLTYSSACNFNNIYICALPRISKGSSLKYLLPSQKEIITSNINSVKTINTEIVFLDPIYKAVTFGLPNENVVTISDIDYCQIRIIRTVGNKRASKSIINDVISSLQSFFDPTNFQIGQKLNYTDLISTILSINGVNSIQTFRTDTGETYNGLSLFIWNPNYPLYDKNVITSDVGLRDFEFLYFHDLVNVYQKIQINEEPYITLE
jgi:hypothetical protein